MFAFRYENNKLQTSYQDSLRNLTDRKSQWEQYETEQEKLLAWLTEIEQVLKSYGLKATLEEKQEQLAKFQVRNLRGSESATRSEFLHRSCKSRSTQGTLIFKNSQRSQTSLNRYLL